MQFNSILLEVYRLFKSRAVIFTYLSTMFTAAIKGLI